MYTFVGEDETVVRVNDKDNFEEIPSFDFSSYSFDVGKTCFCLEKTCTVDHGIGS
jgi:hypothetical protein